MTFHSPLVSLMRELRGEVGLTQRSWALRAGLGPKYVETVERGHQPRVRAGSLECLAEVVAFEECPLASDEERSERVQELTSRLVAAAIEGAQLAPESKYAKEQARRRRVRRQWMRDEASIMARMIAWDLVDHMKTTKQGRRYLGIEPVERERAW